MPRHPFYNTNLWKRLRRQKLASTNFLCEQCGGLASEVDHILAINQGGAPGDLDNLMSLCHKCHSRKTYYVEVLGEKGVPVKGVDPTTGMPLDPNHWWN